MAASKQFCCMHPQQRIDSPEPPPRPLASIDGIFAAAALPEDHPHALQFKNLPEKKPELDPTIVRSPGFTDKIKMQWRKKSAKSLSKEKEYDDDAKAITSQEVLVEFQALPDSERSCSSEHKSKTQPALLSVEALRCPSETGSKAEIRSSVLGSAEYLRPLIEQPSMITVSGQSYNTVDVARRVANQRAVEDVAQENDRPLPPLPKSLSSPLLLPGSTMPAPAPPRRTKSELGLCDVLKLPKTRDPSKQDVTLFAAIRRDDDEQRARMFKPTVPSLHVEGPTSAQYDATNNDRLSDHIKAEADDPSEESHLYTMDISHQLRSMSQLSDPVEDDASLISSNPWNFHHRERLGVGFDSSARSCHSRIKSSTGIDSTAVPSAWGRVRSPTAASSIYSRPTSAGANAADYASVEVDRPPGMTPLDLNTLFADWPLRPSASSDRSAVGAMRRDKPLPQAPSKVRKESGAESLATTKDKDSAETTSLSPPPQTNAAPRTSSSSIISSSSKKSRFLERFSPPKRLVRKRRSIFKFLRPGSRKQQARSISSPILGTKSPRTTYDGPSDDPALLTVQYELVEQPQHTTRSASMNQLSTGDRQSTSATFSPPPLQRQPTFADYERNLSIMGDDRRRPSSMNLTRLNEIQEEDRRESIGVRRKLSRAKELKDDVSPLMAQALTKHQREKEAFRASSKRRGTHGEASARPTPVFSSSLFGAGGSSLAPTPEGESEMVDPLEEQVATATPGPAGQENSAAYLSPITAAAGPSGRSSTSAALTTPSITASSTRQSFIQPSARQPKIGTSLASWSRYPSHTRFERSGSAGEGDNVISRDFAFNIDPDAVRASDDDEEGDPLAQSGTPKSKTSSAAKERGSKKKQLNKSRSLTFGSIKRYYSNLFHSPSSWSGQNRRTSVTLGGKLEHPELELLPPQTPEGRGHSHETLQRLKEIVREDAEKLREFVHEEEGKLGGFVRKEEGKLSTFVHDEESKLGRFVGEEEDKLKKFVMEEEEKLAGHPHHHHGKGSPPPPPFRHGSIFGAQGHLGAQSQRRDTMMIDPIADADENTPEDPSPPLPPQPAAHEPSYLHLDGTFTSTSTPAATATNPLMSGGLPPSSPSKAQLHADSYTSILSPRPGSRSESMPPPRQPKHAIAGSETEGVEGKRVRRYPSVTVIDDQKGHYRSISLISVRTAGRS